MPLFERDDLRIHYAQRGNPDGVPVVLMHGVLWSARMWERMSGMLPEMRLLLLDLHGHGKSSKPTDPYRYRWQEFVDDVVALLDHLGIERAVVGGASLGAAVTLRTATQHPERVAAMVLEMPALSNSYRFDRMFFGTLAEMYRGGGPVWRSMAALFNRVPVAMARYLPEFVAFRDAVGMDPRVGAAIITGLFADGPTADDAESLACLTMPALVIGHGADAVHTLGDARQLAQRLPDGRLLTASTILDLQLFPRPLAAEVRRLVARTSF